MLRRLRALPLTACLLALPAGCGGDAPDPDLGRKRYATFCASCHGGQGAGLSTAPGFEGLGQHWTAETLAEYLGDPRAWIERDERLAAMKQAYAVEMPAFGLPEADRLAVAEYVLELARALEP